MSVQRIAIALIGAPLAGSLRPLAMLAALVLGLLFWAEEAEARFDSELSFVGADGAALASQSIGVALLDEIASQAMTLPAYMVPQSATQPAAPNGSLVGLFNRPGLLGGFAAGFLGAGLFGLLFGQGLAGGLTGIAAVLGLIFQLVLLAILARLIWTWWHGHKTGLDGLSPRQLADAYGSPRHEKLPTVDSPATAEPSGSEPNATAGNGGGKLGRL